MNQLTMIEAPAAIKMERHSKTLKKIRFNKDNEFFLIPNRCHATKEEIQAANYSDKEFGAIRQRERRLARQLSRLGSLIDVDEDELGLESSQTKSRRKLRQQEGQMSVLLEQTMQNDLNQPDQEYLASIYAHYTRESASLAHNRGLRVAEHVKIMTFCESSSQLGKQEAQQQPRPAVSTSRCRIQVKASPMENILSTQRQKQPEHSRVLHPWEQWAKHVSCDTKETIQIRSRWYRVE